MQIYFHAYKNGINFSGNEYEQGILLLVGRKYIIIWFRLLFIKLTLFNSSPSVNMFKISLYINKS